MSTFHHTEHTNGFPLSTPDFNGVYSTLDAAINTNVTNVAANAANIADILDASDAFDEAALFTDQGSTPSTPAAGLTKVFSKADGLYVVDDAGTETGPLTAGGADYIKIIDSQAKNTEGGASSATTWHTRVLNTESFDTGSIASIAANVVTLAAGTYRIAARAPGFRCDAHRLIWYNDTDGATECIGDAADASSSSPYAQTHALLNDRFTIAAQKTFTLRHYTESARTTNGLGQAMNVTDPDAADLAEIYAVVELWRVAT